MLQNAQPYRSLFEHNVDGVLFMGLNGTFVEVNRSAEWMFGYTAQEFQTMGLESICAPDQLERNHEELRLALLGETHELETAMVRKSGESFESIITYGPVLTRGSVQELFLTVKDISERKRIEKELLRLRDELELRVFERTTQLENAVKSLRNEVSQHEITREALRESSLRLRALAAQLCLAEQRERERLAHVLHDDLQQILASTKFRLSEITRDEEFKAVAAKATGLIDSAISIARSLASELSPPVLQKCNLKETMAWLADWAQEKYGLSVEVESPEDLIRQSYDIVLLLFQATRELLFNVRKHAGVGSARIRITRQKNWVCVVVQDEGSGFDPSRLRSERGIYTGFGLLSISERVKLLGGKFSIDSTPGRGSRFAIYVPMHGEDHDYSRVAEENG